MKHYLLLCLLLGSLKLFSQNNALKNAFENRLHKDEITQNHVTPAKLVWTSDQTGKNVKNPEDMYKKINVALN